MGFRFGLNASTAASNSGHRIADDLRQYGKAALLTTAMLAAGCAHLTRSSPVPAGGTRETTDELTVTAPFVAVYKYTVKEVGPTKAPTRPRGEY